MPSSIPTVLKPLRDKTQCPEKTPQDRTAYGGREPEGERGQVCSCILTGLFLNLTSSLSPRGPQGQAVCRDTSAFKKPCPNPLVLLPTNGQPETDRSGRSNETTRAAGGCALRPTGPRLRPGQPRRSLAARAVS